ncbi:hypothetical protein N0V90_002043 [Kalmusia sp. IMI 367209]|nr:hypothetical protein N0V90_002043 [Kalmusia sp. IMI 367209]
MSLSDNVSVTALVISIVALGIGFASFFAQLFATAEGYRKCKHAVIGPWANHTRRHWLGFEFRYEVLYVTPEILLLTKDEIEKIRDSKHAAAHLTEIEAGARAEIKPAGFFKRLSQGFRAQESYEDNVKALKECLTPNLLTTDEGLIKTPTRTANAVATLKRTAPSMDYPTDTDFSEHPSPHPSKTYIADTEMLVSWALLLREMHRLYIFSLSHTDLDGVSKGKDCASPAVVYRRRSWDLVPPDVARPLAKTSVGAIVVLATRYGMQWKTLERQKGVITMIADGNGYVLNSVYVRGMGLVVSFLRSSTSTSGTKAHTPIPNFIPTRLADKMLCGILPGCPSLLNHEFNLMGDDHQVKHNELLDYLSIDPFTRGPDSLPNYHESTGAISVFVNPFRRTGFNDLVLLIPPFLPSTLSTNKTSPKHEYEAPCDRMPQVAIQFSAFLGQNKYSIFTYIEGRMALLRSIYKLVPNPDSSVTSPLSMQNTDETRDCEPRTPENTSLDWICLCFREFATHAASDFFQAEDASMSGIWAGVNENQRIGTNREKRVALVRFCRKVHAHTTHFFECFQNRAGEKGNAEHVGFTTFLRAHSKLAENAGLDVRDHERLHVHVPPWNMDFIGERNEAGNHKRVSIMRETLWKIGNQYVAAVEKGDFRKELGEEGKRLSELDAKIAWWMLMLRGISWTMSVFIETKNEVPSSFHADPTPVWIT